MLPNYNKYKNQHLKIIITHLESIAWKVTSFLFFDGLGLQSTSDKRSK